MVFAGTLLSGALIGLAIAAPVGPMAVLCIRRTLAGGLNAGLCTGAGASTVHLAYASLATLGLQGTASLLQRHHTLLDLVTAVLMLVFAARMLRPRSRQLSQASPTSRSMLGNYASAVAFNAFNPFSLVLLFSATASIIGPHQPEGREVAQLLTGVFLGSIAWWIGLASATAAVGIRLSPRWVRAIDILAGAVLAALGLRTLVHVIVVA